MTSRDLQSKASTRGAGGVQPLRASRSRAGFLTAALGSGLLAGAVGCGAVNPKRPELVAPVESGTDQKADATHKGDADAKQAFEDGVKPPKDYYDALFKAAVGRADKGANLGLGDAPAVLWVNFDGATVTRGFDPGQSFIVCQGSATIPPATELSASDRHAVVEQVQQYYDATGAKLQVTSSKPAGGDFTTIHVGGTYADLGCSGNGVLGIAPFDVGNANRNDIGFVFSGSTHDAHAVAIGVAHEAGHSFGLDHVTNRSDLMYPVAVPEAHEFEASTRQNGVRQDEPAILKQALDTAAAATTTSAATTTPAAGGGGSQGGGVKGLPNLPAGLSNLPGLSQLGNLGGLLGGGGGGGGGGGLGGLLGGLGGGSGGGGLGGILSGFSNLIPGGGGNLGGLGGILGGLGGGGGGGGLGGLAGGLGGLAGGLGGGGLGGGGLGGLGGLLGGQGSSGGGASANPVGGASLTDPAPTSPALPDLASYLGLSGNGTAPGILIRNFEGTVAVVRANYKGDQGTAMLSFVKAAYGQAYAQAVGQKGP